MTGAWRCSLHGHAIEVVPHHGYVKIDGHLDSVPAVQGLQDVGELRGAPLEAIERLLGHPAIRPAPPAPSAPTPSAASSGARRRKPGKKTRVPRPKTKPPTTPDTNSDKPQQTATPEPSTSPLDVFDTNGAGRHLGLSPATLTTMRTRGGGPVFVKLGRRVVYRRADLDA